MGERIVGLSFDGGQIRAVEVAFKGRSGPEVVHAGSIAVPTGSMESGQITDGDLLSEALRSLWSDVGFGSRRVRLSIDGQLALLRRTELPLRRQAELREAAAYDIGELLNYPIEQAVFDVAVLDRFEREGMEWVSALVVSVAEPVLLEFANVLTAAGLKMIEAEFVADALCTVVSGPPTAEEPSLAAIVDVEDTVTSVFARDAGGTVFARAISAGVSATTLSLADVLEEELAQLSGQTTVDASVRTAAGVFNVVEAVRRTLGYFSDEVDSRPITSLTLTGSRAHAPGLHAALEAAVGMPAVPALPSIPWPPTVAVEFCGFEVALGAALMGDPAHQPDRRLRLQTEHGRRLRHRSRQRVVTGLLTSLLLIVLSIDGLGRWADARHQQQVADLAEDASSVVLSELDELDWLVERRTALETGDDRMAELGSQQVRFLDVLQETAELMPAESQLLSVELRRTDEDGAPTGFVGESNVGLVTFTGVAASLDTVGAWLQIVDGGRLLDGLWLDQTTYGPLDGSEREASFFVVDGVITQAALGTGASGADERVVGEGP